MSEVMSDIDSVKRIKESYDKLYRRREMKPEDVVREKLDKANKRIAELEAELSDMRESLQLLHDIMLMGGFDCPELDQAKALLPTPPDTGEKPLEVELAEAKHRLEWYETRFKPPVQPPTEQWMAEMKEQDSNDGK